MVILFYAISVLKSCQEHLHIYTRICTYQISDNGSTEIIFRANR